MIRILPEWTLMAFIKIKAATLTTLWWHILNTIQFNSHCNWLLLLLLLLHSRDGTLTYTLTVTSS